jgi:N-methylhydantoinase B/oxoprolinase/acetone carboxylase alpha subunit
MTRKLDGIELEILWSNLIGIVSEQAKALQRIAFSPIVREAGDLASALFDARGRMVAERQATSIRWQRRAAICTVCSTAHSRPAMC